MVRSGRGASASDYREHRSVQSSFERIQAPDRVVHVRRQCTSTSLSLTKLTHRPTSLMQLQVPDRPSVLEVDQNIHHMTKRAPPSRYLVFRQGTRQAQLNWRVLCYNTCAGASTSAPNTERPPTSCADTSIWSAGSTCAATSLQ